MDFQIVFNGDGTYFLQGYLNGAFLNSETGSWQLSGTILHQISPNTGNDSSPLTWINRNQFKVVDPNEGIALSYWCRVPNLYAGAVNVYPATWLEHQVAG